MFFSTRYCVGLLNGETEYPQVSRQVQYYRNVVEQYLTQSEFVWTGCICIKKCMFDQYGKFVPGVKLGEDTDMWKRIYVHTGIVRLDKVTVKRNRDGSEATKGYTRSYEVDPLHRVPEFLSDSSITEDIKESIRNSYELEKLSVVRSYLYEGNKKKATELLDKIDKKRITKKRLLITYLCFIVPSVFIRKIISLKNKQFYK